MESKVTLIAGYLALLACLSGEAIASNNVPKLYEEIGCTEVKEAGGVTRFNCPDFKTYAKDKCYLKGKVLNVGDSIDDDELHCRAACKCMKHGDEDAKIVCAGVECPEFFGPHKPECVNQYSDLKKCCRFGEICDKARDLLRSCEFEGKSYRAGQKMYPEDKPYTCLCNEHFNNLTSVEENPDCAKIDCAIELNLHDLKAGCLPVYYKSPNSCPIQFRCPEKSDIIESKAAAHEKLTCTYGDLTLKRGDQLKTADKCLTCDCSVPPYATCIKTC